MQCRCVGNIEVWGINSVACVCVCHRWRGYEVCMLYMHVVYMHIICWHMLCAVCHTGMLCCTSGVWGVYLAHIIGLIRKKCGDRGLLGCSTSQVAPPPRLLLSEGVVQQYVCVNVCLSVYTYAFVWLACGGRKVLFLRPFSPCFFSDWVSHYPETHQMASAGLPERPRDMTVSASPVLRLQV